MSLPETLQKSLEQILQNVSPLSLRKAQEALTQKYREGAPSSFSEEAQKLVYLATRFPATYGAAHRVLQELKRRIPPFTCQRILDLGAGPGTAAWAALDLFPEAKEVVLVEKSSEAIALGKELSKGFPLITQWVNRDVQSTDLFPPTDLALASYSLGEWKDPEAVIERLWQGALSYCVLIEPGTPRGYQNLLRIRDRLIQAGAHLVAPCPHSHRCPLSGGDWCHFSVRIERSSFHRFLKRGTLGYEDEKFSYLIAAKTPLSISPFSRILRPPHKGSGHVRLTLCHPSGNQIETTVSRKEKILYKKARDAEWGDAWEI